MNSNRASQPIPVPSFGILPGASTCVEFAASLFNSIVLGERKRKRKMKEERVCYRISRKLPAERERADEAQLYVRSQPVISTLRRGILFKFALRPWRCMPGHFPTKTRAIAMTSQSSNAPSQQDVLQRRKDSRCNYSIRVCGVQPRTASTLPQRYQRFNVIWSRLSVRERVDWDGAVTPGATPQMTSTSVRLTHPTRRLCLYLVCLGTAM